MKKKLRIISFMFLLLAISCSTAWTMDFVNMSNEELFELQGAIQNAPEADKNAYQLEWDKRVTCMTSEEKKLFFKTPKEEDDGKLKEPVVPAQGYEKQVGPDNIIFGGVPQNGGFGR